MRSYGAPGGRLDSIQLGDRTLDYDWGAGGGAPWLTVHDDLDGAGDSKSTRYWLSSAQQLERVEYGYSTVHGEAYERRTYAHRADGGRLSEAVQDCDWVQQLDGNGDPILDEDGEPVLEFECADRWRTAFGYDAIGQVSQVDTIETIEGVDQAAQMDQIGRDGFGRVTEARTGGVHKQMTWDAAGRMLSVDADGVVSDYRYDTSGMRITRDVGGAVTRSAWDAGGLLAELSDGSTKTYLRGAGLVLGTVAGNGDLTRMGHDHLGSPVISRARVGGAFEDPTVLRFGALGRVRSGVCQSGGVGFTGHQLDASGLTYAQARYYDPGMGGFLTSDPWSGSLGMPRTLGRFAYVVGHPVGMVDPDGREPRRGQLATLGQILAEVRVVRQRTVGEARQRAELWNQFLPDILRHVPGKQLNSTEARRKAAELLASHFLSNRYYRRTACVLDCPVDRAMEQICAPVRKHGCRNPFSPSEAKHDRSESLALLNRLATARIAFFDSQGTTPSSFVAEAYSSDTCAKLTIGCAEMAKASRTLEEYRLVDKASSEKHHLRYLYTTSWGWIDFHHFFKLASSNLHPVTSYAVWGPLGEMYQGWNGQSSSWSYEDLPSDLAGIGFRKWLEHPMLSRGGGVMLPQAEALDQAFSDIEAFLNLYAKKLGAVHPTEAPNWDLIPHTIISEDPPPKVKVGFRPLVGRALRHAFEKRAAKWSESRRKKIEKATQDLGGVEQQCLP